MRYENEIIIKIEKQLNEVAGDPEYFLARNSCFANSLRNKENLQSFLLEHPEYFFANSNKKNNRFITNGVKQLDEAWKYLNKNIPNLENCLDANKFIDLAKIVNPNVDGFRRVRVSMNLPNYVPPNPIKVPELMENLCEQIKSEDLHSIERAFLIHLGIASIQPIIDGNKRTGRLLQNKVLNDEWLPPAIVYFKDRDNYLHVLEGAMNAYREGDLKHQAPFFDYMSKQLLNSFESLLRGLGYKDIKGGCLQKKKCGHCKN